VEPFTVLVKAKRLEKGEGLIGKAVKFHFVRHAQSFLFVALFLIAPLENA